MSDDLIARLRDAVNGEHDMTPHGADVLQAINRIEELEGALHSILMLPNSPSAQGIMKVFAEAALKEYDN
tara:strand:- start:425 stop:634 length:210 start_codon:yes stop_codon:yes gene_type:complete